MISSLWMEATPATRFSTDSSKYAKKRLDPLQSIAKVGLCSQTIFVQVILVFHFIFFRPICILCTSRALLLDGYVILLFDIQAVLAGVLTPECKLKCDESSFSTENIRIFSVCAPPPPPPLRYGPPPLPGTLCPSPVCYAPQVRYAPPRYRARHYIVNHHVKIWNVRLGGANNMRPLSWGGGGGAQTEKIRKIFTIHTVIGHRPHPSFGTLFLFQRVWVGRELSLAATL